ncbi:MAG: amidohydrolase family protein [Chloroflexi bacterium]|nr:amidohydrolase family protein [Chloroflexota bacterium]
MNDQVTLIGCGTLIDGCGGTPQHDVGILVEGNRIDQIIPLAQAPTGERLTVIDASRQTVMPGLMDIHLHLVTVLDPQETHTFWSMMAAPPPLLTLHAAKNARLMLEAGFTTVRDLGGYINRTNVEVVSLRRAIEMDLVPGPRVFAAGWVTQTAGHIDMGFPATWPREPGICADGPWEVRKLARTLFRLGVDLLKTTSSGGLSGYWEDLTWRNYTVEELAALADEAHAVGKRLAVHTDTPAGIKNAVIAGADTLEHCTIVDDEALDLMVKHGTYMVPTLSLGSERAAEGRRRGGTARPDVLRKASIISEGLRASFQKAHRAGVKIATGTDTYFHFRDRFGESAYELELMVQYGMSPMEAIVASTRSAADALGAADRLGTVEPGKLADLIVVDGNPLDDVRILQDKARILVVMKDGKVAVDRRPALGGTSPPVPLTAGGEGDGG